MATGLKTLIISFLLVGLFTYSFISFGDKFQNDMDANQTLLNESDSNLNSTYGFFRTNLEESEDTANTSRTSFESEKVTSEFGSLTLSSVVGVAKSFTGTMIGFFNVIFDLIKVVFGFDEGNSAAFTAVIGTLSAILLITIIFFAWRWIRTGS